MKNSKSRVVFKKRAFVEVIFDQHASSTCPTKLIFFQFQILSFEPSTRKKESFLLEVSYIWRELLLNITFNQGQPRRGKSLSIRFKKPLFLKSKSTMKAESTYSKQLVRNQQGYWSLFKSNRKNSNEQVVVKICLCNIFLAQSWV